MAISLLSWFNGFMLLYRLPKRCRRRIGLGESDRGRMLSKRSRGAVTSNQALMADHASLPSPTDRYIRHASSFFSSSGLFPVAKGFSEIDSMVSPTSILDTKPFSSPGTPISSDRSTTKSPEPILENKHPLEKLERGSKSSEQMIFDRKSQ